MSNSKASAFVHLFFEALCGIFESPHYVTHAELESRLLEIGLHSGIPYYNRYQGLVAGLRILRSDYKEHNIMLRATQDKEPLRMTLLHSLGYYGREVDKQLFTHEPDFFHMSGGGLAALRFESAVKIAAFLETFPTVFIDTPHTGHRQIDNANLGQLTWFQYPTIPTTGWLAPEFNPSSKTSFQLFRLEEWGGDQIAGLTLVKMVNYIEISVHLERPFSMIDSKLDDWLVYVAQRMQINGPRCYSVTAPFFSSGPNRIYRMSFPRDSSPHTRYRLYTRIFSPRTEEATFYKGEQRVTVRFPSTYRDYTTRAIRSSLWTQISNGQASQ